MAVQHEPVLEEFRKSFSLARIQEISLAINHFERTSSHSGFRKSAKYCEDVLKQSGFEQVEFFTHPADGRTSALETIMPEAWDLTGRSYLEIVSGDLSDYERMLADTDHHPVEGVLWSKPTPPEGITAELVDYADLDPENPDVRGKWVFMAPFNRSIYRKAAEAGAVGIAATDYRNIETSPDDPIWFNGQGRVGWYHEKDDPRLPFFSIPPLRAARLQERLKKEKVVVHGVMNSRIYDGEIFTVTGIIPGESEEEYALLAHIYEPFLADDALGAAVACELGRVLRECKVPLKKTLRVIISMELYGFSAYLADQEHRCKIQAGLSLDGFVYRWRNIDLRQTPLSLPCFTDWFFRDWFKQFDGFEWLESAGNLSDDTFPGDPAIGFPVNWLRSPSAPHHHCTDIYYQPEWQFCREKFLYLVSALSTLLTLDFNPDYVSRSVQEFRQAVQKLLQDTDISDYEKNIRFEAEYLRYSGMLRSWERFSGKHLDISALDQVRDRLKKQLPDCRISQLLPIQSQAMALIPERLTPGAPFCLCRVPYAEKKSFTMPRLLWALMDGKRDLLACIRLMDAGLGIRSTDAFIQKVVDAVCYLEKYGYLNLRSNHCSKQ